eukprot:15479145-Alexandrium_andersonii.AAC.1
MNNAGQYVQLTKAPGFHLTLVLQDFVHIVPLGVLPVCVGSVLEELRVEKVFGPGSPGGWRVYMETQLKTAYEMFKEHCRQNCIDHNQPQFKVPRAQQGKTFIANAAMHFDPATTEPTSVYGFICAAVLAT